MASGEGFGVACIVICIFVVATPLAITSIVLSRQNGVCDNLDLGTNLTVAQWLLGYGIASLTVTCILCISIAFMWLGSALAKCVMVTISVLNSLFGLAWFIIGGVVLFRSNVDCIQEGVTYVVFALAMWCISAFFIVFNCSRVNIKPSDV